MAFLKTVSVTRLIALFTWQKMFGYRKLLRSIGNFRLLKNQLKFVDPLGYAANWVALCNHQSVFFNLN